MIRPRPDSVAVAALLTMLVAFGPISTDMYLPSLPALVSDFDSDVPTVQLTLSAFLVAFAVSMLVYGPLSDRFGRRPVLIGAIAIAGGFTDLARPSKVVVRRITDDGVKAFEINVSKMQRDQTNPFMLEPNDTVTVTESIF